MNKFVSRVYNRFQTNYSKGTTTKFSKEDRLKNEANYYASLPGELKIFFPRLLTSGFDHSTQENFMEIEYYPYYNLSDLIIFDKGFSGGPLAMCVAEQIYYMLKEFSKHKPKTTDKSDLEKIYITKTETEQQNLVNNFEYFSEFAKHDIVKINDVEYENFHIIWPKLKKAAEWTFFGNVQYSIIHGDLCFSNILCGDVGDCVNSVLKLIDPRGEFGQHKIYGDIYYDLAKLHHSTNTGYELIINDYFTLTSEANSVNFTFSKFYENKKNAIHEQFQEYLYSHYIQEKIKLIESTIFVGMAARHYDSLDRQKVMYSSGIKLMNEVYNEIINLPSDGYH